MKAHIGIGLALLATIGLGSWAWSQAELQFSNARVAATFVEVSENGSARNAIKVGLERYAGTLDIAISDFNDLPLQFVLIRLSSQRPIRLLLGRGGAVFEQETELCKQLGELFEIRFSNEMGHRFVVAGDRGVMLSSVDWTGSALNGSSQSIIEVESTTVAQSFSAQFNMLWEQASTSCSDALQFP